MKIVHLTQGSPEWLEYRRTMRNASETAAVLGVSPWLTPYQLWLLKTGRKTQEVSAAMQHGTNLEPAARAAYEAQTGLVMQPLVVQDGVYSASLDGMTLDGDLIVEIKCPFRGQESALWKEVKAGWVPDHYAAQIQHQMMVSGASLAHLWVFDGTQGLLRPVERIDAATQRIHEAWEIFQGYIDSDTPPPLTDADTALREDTAWSSAAQAFVQAKQAAEAADAALAQARDALVGLAGHPREQGAGVTVTRYWKAGNVDYKKVPALAGVDLNGFRGKGREEVRVTSS
jgi:putative phage-type endonuclease